MAIGNCGPYATGGADDGYGLGMERDEERSGSAARLAAATGNGRSAARQSQAPTIRRLTESTAWVEMTSARSLCNLGRLCKKNGFHG
jgi:hypothetical protein